MTDDLFPPPEGFDPISEEELGALAAAIDGRLVAWKEGFARMEAVAPPLAGNRQGLLHGGAYAILLDTAACYAGTFCAYPGRTRRAVTLSLNTQFQGSAKVGDTIVTEGVVTTGGRSVFFAEAKVTDLSGRVLASAQGVFKYRSGSTTPHGEPR